MGPKTFGDCPSGMKFRFSTAAIFRWRGKQRLGEIFFTCKRLNLPEFTCIWCKRIQVHGLAGEWAESPMAMARLPAPAPGLRREKPYATAVVVTPVPVFMTKIFKEQSER